MSPRTVRPGKLSCDNRTHISYEANVGIDVCCQIELHGRIHLIQLHLPPSSFNANIII